MVEKSSEKNSVEIIERQFDAISHMSRFEVLRNWGSFQEKFLGLKYEISKLLREELKESTSKEHLKDTIEELKHSKEQIEVGLTYTKSSYATLKAQKEIVDSQNEMLSFEIEKLQEQLIQKDKELEELKKSKDVDSPVISPEYKRNYESIQVYS